MFIVTSSGKWKLMQETQDIDSGYVPGLNTRYHDVYLDDFGRMNVCSGSKIIRSSDGGRSWYYLIDDSTFKSMKMVGYNKESFVVLDSTGRILDFNAPRGVVREIQQPTIWGRVTDIAIQDTTLYVVTDGMGMYSTALRRGTLSVKELSQCNHVILAYPNPTTTHVDISMEQATAPYCITIYDCMGRVVWSSPEIESGSGIRWTCIGEGGIRVPTGMYIIRITSGDDSISGILTVL
jgi:hypothetical protein